MSAEAATRLDWCVHLPTADVTCVRLRLPPRRPTDPWPLPRALAELGRQGARTLGGHRALGDRRTVPVLSSAQLLWRGHDLFLEAFHDAPGGELSLTLPSWDELAAGEANEAQLWDLVDAAATAAAARVGAITDGEALAVADGAPPWEAMLRRHIGILAPGWVSADMPAARGFAYRMLPASGLEVILR